MMPPSESGQVDLTRAVSMRGALAWLMAGGSAAALVDRAGRRATRSVRAPRASASSSLGPTSIASAGSWSSVAPGDKVVALGSDVSVSATVHSRFGEAVPRDEAWLEWTGTDGKPNRVQMAADADAKQGQRAFAVTLPRLTGSLDLSRDCRRRCQPAASHQRWSNAPAVANLKAHVEPPAYTRRPGAPARDPARIEAWEDSQVTLEIEANRPLKHAEVDLAGQEAQREVAVREPHPSRVVSLKPGADANTMVGDRGGRGVRPVCLSGCETNTTWKTSPKPLAAWWCGPMRRRSWPLRRPMTSRRRAPMIS